MINEQQLDRLLAKVEKPARYTGSEWNEYRKEGAFFHAALCFPDAYEIGMSHLGSRILYEVMNGQQDVACERVFCPWPDMERALRQEDLPLFSLETRRPLRDFDLVGFSLLYEMCYTNVLTMLELGRIPLLAGERTEDDPIVIGGGPCCVNPEPIAPFLDAVVVGDGEEVMVEILDALTQAKREGASRAERIARLSRLEGLYIPSEPKRVRRRVVADLEHAAYLERPIVPFMGIVHDRVSLEVMRGCTRGCRFCQAGYIYRPVRERSAESLLERGKQLVDCTGYDEISLLSLSTGDYTELRTLLPELMDSMAKQRVSVALPSLRIDAGLGEMLQKMQSVRKAGLTFAPEAGTQRLRDVINKNVTEEDLLRAARDAFAAGWTSVKLYFMLGLPTETDADILGIADLAGKVARAWRETPPARRGKGLRLSVSVSTFVPKPFTPFQWCPQDSQEEIWRKQQLLRSAMKGVRGVTLHCHPSRLSLLEAAFSRGDRRLAEVLLAAYQNGARFDSWTEHFSRDAWAKAFETCGLTPEEFALAELPLDAPLPWSHIDIGVTADYLKREHERAMAARTTPDCRGNCQGCYGRGASCV
ncbi:MAG: TIGR03960 family B12-binding radical SAM protein [Clostridiales bacterium]|nr:TIGR03960 family B12-binding radical SAM protein [Clostridiales bacterium]